MEVIIPHILHEDSEKCKCEACQCKKYRCEECKDDRCEACKAYRCGACQQKADRELCQCQEYRCEVCQHKDDRCERCQHEYRCEKCQHDGDQCEECQHDGKRRQLAKATLSGSLNVLSSTVGLRILHDELLLFRLYISLQIALMHDWDPDPYELRLLEVCRIDHPKLGPLERRFYRNGGGDKAIIALYRETLDSKWFFTSFNMLSRRSQKSLIYLTNYLVIDDALSSRLREKAPAPTTLLHKFTKIPRKPRAQSEARPPRKPLQRVKSECSELTQLSRRNDDSTPLSRHHLSCEKEPPRVASSSSKRKRSGSPEKRSKLISDSAQPPASTIPQTLPPTASQLPAGPGPEYENRAAGRNIVVQDHSRPVSSQPDHNQSPALTEFENENRIPLVSSSQVRPVWDTQALGEHPEQLTSNPAPHGSTRPPESISQRGMHNDTGSIVAWAVQSNTSNASFPDMQSLPGESYWDNIPFDVYFHSDDIDLADMDPADLASVFEMVSSSGNI